MQPDAQKKGGPQDAEAGKPTPVLQTEDMVEKPQASGSTMNMTVRILIGGTFTLSNLEQNLTEENFTNFKKSELFKESGSEFDLSDWENKHNKNTDELPDLWQNVEMPLEDEIISKERYGQEAKNRKSRTSALFQRSMTVVNVSGYNYASQDAMKGCCIENLACWAATRATAFDWARIKFPFETGEHPRAASRGLEDVIGYGTAYYDEGSHSGAGKCDTGYFMPVASGSRVTQYLQQGAPKRAEPYRLDYQPELSRTNTRFAAYFRFMCEDLRNDRAIFPVGIQEDDTLDRFRPCHFVTIVGCNMDSNELMIADPRSRPYAVKLLQVFPIESRLGHRPIKVQEDDCKPKDQEDDCKPMYFSGVWRMARRQTPE